MGKGCSVKAASPSFMHNAVLFALSAKLRAKHVLGMLLRAFHLTALTWPAEVRKRKLFRHM